MADEEPKEMKNTNPKKLQKKKTEARNRAEVASPGGAEFLVWALACQLWK